MLWVVIPVLNMCGDGATWIAGVEWIPFVFEIFTFFDTKCYQKKPDKGLSFFRDYARKMGPLRGS